MNNVLLMQILRSLYASCLYAPIAASLLICGNVFSEEFTVTCEFANKAEVSVDSAFGALEAKVHRPAGPGLQQQTFTAEGWSAELAASPDQGFCDAAMRIDLLPETGFSIEINEIEVHQKASRPSSVMARICCTPNGSRPDLGSTEQSSQEEELGAETKVTRFSPAIGAVEADGKSLASVYACARVSDAKGTWMVSRIVIRGTSIPTDLPDNMVVVSGEKRQQMRFGIDAERLWWWYPGIDGELARYAVGDLQADYVRVAINCGYELEEGRKNSRAYDRILNMMEALKKENPGIRFFASPRPLEEAYTQEERDRDWGGGVPWSPYPIWILPFEQEGKDDSGKPVWRMGKLDEKKLVRYIADYLNFMHKEGFSIEYLDATNECNIEPRAVKYLAEHLKELLADGVKMPLIVAPSAWNMAQGVEWVKSADENVLDVIACHNTDPGGSMEEFAELGRKLGKDVWNSELHDWWGVEPREEILNSETLWRHVRAGFNGIDSWLFFGPIGGKDHTMIWTDGSSIRTSYKYEIFRKLVNNANRGYYLETKMPRSDVYTAAFIKDRTVTIWVFNKSDQPVTDLGFMLEGMALNGQNVEVTRWHESISNKGKASKIRSTKTIFTHTIEGESLYCFKIVLP